MADMESSLETQDKKQQTGIRLFIACVALIGACCIAVMNLHYDALARYPYQDQKSRELIKEYLTDDEIDYIIEYSIAPNMFIAYIQEDGFSIYHCQEYKRLSEVAWDQPASEIVSMVEKSRTQMDTETLITYLQNYSWDDMKTWLDQGDVYDEQGVLLLNAASLEACLGTHDTVSVRVPGLASVDTAVIANDSVLVDGRVVEPLQTMCTAIADDLGSSEACAALELREGYVSYEQSETDYVQAQAAYGTEVSLYQPLPGHDEHQLGLALDFGISGIQDQDFSLTRQAQWLAENAWQYGFVQDRTAEEASLTGLQAQDYHYRYVGTELAAQLHADGLSFYAYEESLQTQSEETAEAE